MKLRDICYTTVKSHDKYTIVKPHLFLSHCKTTVYAIIVKRYIYITFTKYSTQ